jgi:hypothetical protein
MTDAGRKIFEGILCDKLLKFRGPKPDRYPTIGRWAMAEAKKIVEMFEPKER